MVCITMIWGCYYPDTNKLNNILYQWNQINIEFCGIIHSHISNQTTLSGGDILYINEILFSMPYQYRTLYFPLVVNGKVISYIATLTEQGMCIDNDIIELI